MRYTLLTEGVKVVVAVEVGVGVGVATGGVWALLLG